MKDDEKTQAQLSAELAEVRREKAQLQQRVMRLEAQVTPLDEEQDCNSQSLFFDILNIANEAIISVDKHQHILLYNDGAEQIFGYSAAEMIGQPLEKLLPEAFRAVHRHHIAEFTQSSTTARYMGKRQEIYVSGPTTAR